MNTRSYGTVDSGSLSPFISRVAFFYKVRNMRPYLGFHLNGSNDGVNVCTTNDTFPTPQTTTSAYIIALWKSL